MDIVEKLRATEMRETGWELGGISITKPTRINPDGPEAADEIERLRWENANMEKLWGKSEGTWMEIRDKQNSEIERLREALRNVLSVQPIKGDEGSTDMIALAKALLEIDSISRAALKGEE
jgi:hypothetical protein